MNIDIIKAQLKKHIVEELNLQDINPEDIQDHTPLFVDGLGLDSIDALELVVIMEKYYGAKIPDEIVGRKVLYSIDTMATYVTEQMNKAK